VLLIQKYSPPTHTTYFHFNFLCASNRIQYRHNAGIKAKFSNIFQTILHISSFTYDYRARDASSDHYHPAIGTLKPHSKMMMATKLLVWEDNNISTEKSFGTTSWSAPNEAVQTVPWPSLLSKCHTVSRYIPKCNFI